MTTNKADNTSVVSIVKADSYDFARVYSAVEKCLGLIGGLDKIVKRGDNVFLKINHLPPSSPPEKGIITHPVFVKAVVENLKKFDVNISVGDDIGSEPVGQRDPEGVDGFTVSGIRQVCRETNVSLVNLREAGFVETDCHGFVLDKVYVSKIVLNADVVINLPKLKTHSLMGYTGGIKNMFGAVPKGKRLQYHYNYQEREVFSQVLVDIFSVIKPTLTIIDGIMAMEGEGPASGNVRKLGLVLASRDTLALDTVVTKIIGLEPSNILTNKYAGKKGLGAGNLRDINTVGEKVEYVSVTDFKLPATHKGKKVNKVLDVLSTFIQKRNVTKPKILTPLCVGCMECKNTCPANAISVLDAKASVDRKKCISCFCCHEACRYNAIILKKPWYMRMLKSLASS